MDPQNVEPNVYKLCIRSPQMYFFRFTMFFFNMSIFSGNKSKLCEEHYALKDTVQENNTDLEVSYRPRTRAFAKACF